MEQNFDIKNYELFQEVSAGAVCVIEKDGIVNVLTIEREKMKDFCLPKGHQEPGESLQETTIREILEETGYKAEPSIYLGEFSYSVKSEEKKVITIRTVHWFLANISEGEKKEADEEVKKVSLAPIDSDLSFLTYENDRMFIDKAREVLKNIKNPVITKND